MNQKDTLKQFIAKRPKTIQIFTNAALRMGVDVHIVSYNDRIWRFTKNGKSFFTFKAILPFGRCCDGLAKSKSATKELLKEHGIAVSNGVVASTYTEAKREMSKITMKKPWILKPVDAEESKGVVWSINSYTELQKSISENKELKERSGIFIVEEEFIGGMEYRVLVLHNKVIACMGKVQSQVITDGVSTIAELIENENSTRADGNKLLYNKTSVKLIKEQGYDTTSIPEKNVIIKTQNINTVATGAQSIDLTNAISKYYKKIAVDVSKLMKYEFLAVDIFAKDITQNKPQAGDYVILEVNDTPAYYRCEAPYVSGKNTPKVSEILINDLLKNGSRVG